MLIIFIIAFMAVFGYLAYIKLRFDVSSASESYYKLSSINPNLGYIFLAWCVAPAFLLFPIWVEIMPPEWQFVPFLSIVMLGAVGCAPRYLHNQKIAHFAFAALTVAFAVFSSIPLGLWWIPTALIPIATIVPLALKQLDYIYYMEVATFLSIFIIIFINII